MAHHGDVHDDDATHELPLRSAGEHPAWMASGGDASGPDTAPSDPSDRPVLDVGLVVSPAALTSATLASDVTAALAAQYPQVEWNLVVVEDRLAEPPVTPLDLIETARDRMLDENWDLVLVLTDLPLKDGRRVVQTQLSPVHGVGLVVVPALGVGQVATKVRAACVRLVEELLHFDGDDTSDDIDRRARQRAEDVEGATTRTRCSSRRACSAATSGCCSGSCEPTVR